MNIGQWVKTNKLTEEQVAIAEELNGRGIETFTDAVFAIGEPALAIISSSIADPIAGLAGIGMSAFDGVARGTDTISNVKNALSYVPKTRAGKVGMKAVADTLQPVSDALTGAEDYLGSNTLELTGSPFLAAAAATIPTALAELNPLGKVSRQADKMGIFAGKKAKTADLNKQAMADELLSRGISRDEIWTETGWFKDVDEQWKFEIDDSDFKVNPIAGEKGQWLTKGGTEVPMAITDFVDHGRTGANYPDLLEGRARLKTGQSGSYEAPSARTFGAERYELPAGHNKDGSLVDPEFSRSVALHETQHGIQQREGFAQGGNTATQSDDYLRDLANKDYYTQEATNARLSSRKTPEYKSIQKQIDTILDAGDTENPNLKSLMQNRRAIENLAAKDFDLEAAALSEKTKFNPFDQYQRLAGEAEARNVETRANMTQTQRIANPPWTTLDVPESELIIKK
jgi:hypothetical protein